MIDVEVRGRLGQYIKAFLRNVIEDEALVFYPHRERDERIPLSRVRLPPAQVSREIQAGQSAEVLFVIANQLNDANETSTNWTSDTNKSGSQSSYSDQLELPAWWPCRVQKVRDDLAAIKLQINAPADATSDDITRCNQLSTVTDIVNRGTLRPPTHDYPCLSASNIHRHFIEIPKDLSDFAADSNVHAEFIRHVGGPVSLYFDKDTSTLTVLSTDEATIQKVALLEETHLKMLRQKWAVTRSLRQTMRNLEGNRVHDTHFNMTSSRSSGDLDTDPNMIIERFYVPQRLMGLAIGAHGHNIRACRELPGIVSIKIRETGDNRRATEDNMGDAALIIIEAKSAEAAKDARSRLEFTELYLGVPRRYVGRLIGRKTSNISSIIEKSGVVEIHFDDHIKGPSDEEAIPNLEHLSLQQSGSAVPSASGMRRVFLRAGGNQPTAQPHSEEDYGGFILSGTRDAVEKARLLISFQLDYIYDLEQMEAERIALIRNLSYTSTDAGSGYPNRWGGPGGAVRVGGGRGGRRPPRGAPYASSDSHASHGLHDGIDADPGSNQYQDEGGRLPQPSGRRPGRTTRGYNGEPRLRRPGGRGGPRRGGAGSNAYSDWADPTGNNGDVADRRRGSADSVDLSHEGESDDQETTGRYRRSNRPDRKRADGGETASSLATDEDNFPCGDGSSNGEGYRYLNHGPRGRGTNRPPRKRTGQNDMNRSHNGRPPRSRVPAGQNGENSSGGSRTPQATAVKYLSSGAVEQPAQV